MGLKLGNQSETSRSSNFDVRNKHMDQNQCFNKNDLMAIENKK